MKRSAEGAGLHEIEAVYRRRLAELRRVATAITGGREPGQDAVQDAFAIAVHRRAQFRGEGSLEGWLWRIVVNTARNVAAGLRASPMAQPAELVQSPEAAPENTGSDMAEVQALVRELPDRQRTALFLHYYADLDYATIADALEISTGTVGATLNQAREALRRRMAETEVRT
jgi:RNA polymerase sigma factor (sigma-70 family)